MPNFPLLIVLQALVTILLVCSRKKIRRWFALGLFLIVAMTVVECAWFAWLVHVYNFDVAENHSTVVVMTWASDTLFGTDTEGGCYVGHIWSPWLKLIEDPPVIPPPGISGYLRKRGYPDEPRWLVWESPQRCWIERFGDDANAAGVCIEKGQDDSWRFRVVVPKSLNRGTPYRFLKTSMVSPDSRYGLSLTPRGRRTVARQR